MKNEQIDNDTKSINDHNPSNKINDLFSQNYIQDGNNQFEIEYTNSKGGFSLLKLYGSDFERLIAPNYLNDNIIFFYLK